MTKRQYSVDFTSYGRLANRYFKGVVSTQTSIFSPNTVFRSLHYSQESLRHVCFLQFSLSLSGHCTFTSVFEIFKSHG